MKIRNRIETDDILITHCNCMDGATCSAVFQLAGGYKNNVHYVTAGNGVKNWFDCNKKILNSDRKIYIADVSFDVRKHKDLAIDLEKRGNVRLIDHHKSALPLKDFSFCSIDLTKCGSSLLMEELFEVSSNVLSDIVENVNDFDMWHNKIANSKDYVCYFDLHGQETFSDRMIDKVLYDYKKDWSFVEQETFNVFELKRQKYVKETASKVTKISRHDIVYGCVFVSEHRSEVLNKILENDQSIDVAAGFLAEENQISLRSRKNGVDVSKIAEKYNGGGHANAAAFSCQLADLFGDIL